MPAVQGADHRLSQKVVGVAGGVDNDDKGVSAGDDGDDDRCLLFVLQGGLAGAVKA